MLLLLAVIAADFQLTFARSGCWGVCPIYHLSIDARGNVAFTGDRFTSVVGEHDRTMRADELQKLVEAIDAVNFFALTDHAFGAGQCRERATDNPATSITVRMNGREHAIRHYLGCRGFRGEKELIAFEQQIDALAGVEPWKRFDPRLDQRRMLVWQLGGHCETGAACEEDAKRLERDSLLLTDHLQIRRDGTALMQTSSIRFVREVRATLSPEHLRELTTRVASIPMPYGIPYVEALPEGLRSLASDQTLTRDARSIRIEAMPAGRVQGSVQPWPADDLVPLAQLTKRTLTRDEWTALRARLLYRKREGGFRLLDGTPFGSDTPVVLRIIATP